jgi:hypothetical protein
MSLAELRAQYHQQVCEQIICITRDARGRCYPNFADSGNRSSMQIAAGIVARLGQASDRHGLTGQEAGGRFEDLTRDFIQAGFELLSHLRPGRWRYHASRSISDFAQYAHLAALEAHIREHRELAASLGTDYIVKPDIVIARYAVSDDEINSKGPVLGEEERLAAATYLRAANLGAEGQILHASISCKWTLRSDRSQNARTEGLNLIRNRKGHTPHIMVVTAEPLPTRIASLALGTGDVDCVYHFALYEMEQTLAELDNQDQAEVLQTLTEGHRLRDISDLPLDLAV